MVFSFSPFTLIVLSDWLRRGGTRDDIGVKKRICDVRKSTKSMRKLDEPTLVI